MVIFFFLKENIASTLPDTEERWAIYIILHPQKLPSPKKRKKLKNPSHNQPSQLLIPEKQKPALRCRSKGKKQTPAILLEILTRRDSKRYFSRKKHLKQRLEKAEVQGELKRKTLSFQLTRLGKGGRRGVVGDDYDDDITTDSLIPSCTQFN